MKIAFGNRHDVPPPTALAARADRAAKNMLEGMVLFVTVLVAARFAGADKDRLALGSTLFFWGRVAYFGIYLAGIAYLRTVVWGVAIAGVFMIGMAAL
jgi:uncharacterized MAPEG superfamily protein